MGRVFLTCFHQLLVREKPSSFTIIDETVAIFASLVIDIQKLEASIDENSLSLQWCTDVVNILRKMQFHLLCFVKKTKATMLWKGVNCIEEYMKESLVVLDFCNNLKSVISEMNRHHLVIDVSAEKLRTASSKSEIEILERESPKLYGIEKRKILNLFNQEMSKTKSKDVNVGVVYAVKGTMSALCLLLFSTLFYPVSIKVDDELFSNFPQLKLFTVSLKKLTCSFNEGLDGINKRPVLVENKMVESTVFQIKHQASRRIAIDEDKYLMLKNSCIALKEALEMFESVVTELFEEAVQGRNQLLAMITTV